MRKHTDVSVLSVGEAPCTGAATAASKQRLLQKQITTLLQKVQRPKCLSFRVVVKIHFMFCTPESHSKHKERGELVGSTWNVLKEKKESAGEFLCDVLLPGGAVNVPDHTLHHPLNAFVHPVPA